MPDMPGEPRDPRWYYFLQGDIFLLPSAYLHDKEDGVIYQACMSALTVCEAFAAEAYLKSLIKMESGEDSPETHNLKVLFGMLQPDTRKAIRREWLKRHADEVLNVDHGDGFKRVKSFEEALDLSAQAFIKFRYNLTENIGWHMRALGYLVRRQILRRKPEWSPPAGSYFSLIDPHPDFVKPELQQPSGATRSGAIFNYQSPAFKIQVGNGADPQDDGTR